MRNSTRGDVDPFIVMDVMEAARAAEAEGRHIIHMEVGQPGTGASPTALAQLAGDFAQPLGYTVGLGLPELRARIARHYRDWYGITLDPERVVITSGASGAFLLAFSALFDNDARVGVGLPGYPSYRQILKAMGLAPVEIVTRAEDSFHPQPNDIAAHALDGLIVASPANPTGTMLGLDNYLEFDTAARAANCALISDEIYHGLTYDTPQVTALQATDHVYVINSFSKYFAMTGWRVGWMVVPQDHVRTVERLAQNMFICASHASQRLALYSFDAQKDLELNHRTYTLNRKLVIAGLQEAGLTTMAPPDGAFYVYADVSAYADDSVTFAREILEHVGVAVTPGLDFDPVRGHQWLRFSYAGTTADIIEGMSRLQSYLATRCSD